LSSLTRRMLNSAKKLNTVCGIWHRLADARAVAIRSRIAGVVRRTLNSPRLAMGLVCVVIRDRAGKNITATMMQRAICRARIGVMRNNGSTQRQKTRSGAWNWPTRYPGSSRVA
jgi:hypothetical protein